MITTNKDSTFLKKQIKILIKKKKTTKGLKVLTKELQIKILGKHGNKYH